jgi:hypothetical protein
MRVFIMSVILLLMVGCAQSNTPITNPNFNLRTSSIEESDSIIVTEVSGDVTIMDDVGTVSVGTVLQEGKTIHTGLIPPFVNDFTMNYKGNAIIRVYDDASVTLGNSPINESLKTPLFVSRGLAEVYSPNNIFETRTRTTLIKGTEYSIGERNDVTVKSFGGITIVEDSEGIQNKFQAGEYGVFDFDGKFNRKGKLNK